MSVEEQVRADLAVMRGHAPDVADSALAASALLLASLMDDPGNSATSKSMCARALHDALAQLRELAPPVQKTDGIDELKRERDKRRAAARASGSAG